MIGDERVRYCPECKLNVYNFSAMPEGDIQQLIATRKGRLCARWFRRTDGTMLTADCPVGFRARVRKISLVAGAALSAMMSVGTARAQQADKTSTSSSSLVQIDKAQQGEGIILVRVVDETGAVIPGADISVLDSERRLVIQGTTSSLGEFRASGLTEASFSIRVHSAGFAPAEIRGSAHAVGSEGAEGWLQVTLNLGVMGEVIEVRKPNLVHRLFSKMHGGA